MTPKPKQEEVKVVKTTIRVPRALWDAVRRRAIDERSSAQEIIDRALRAYLKRAKGKGGD